MNARQFTAALAKLGITQNELARTLKVNERTVRNWGRRSAVPNVVIALLNLCRDSNTDPKDLRV
jgi:DNA-binding transcriptional regulator YiaG